MNYQLYKLRNKLPLLAYHNVKHRLMGGKILYPFAVQYNITYNCNLKCIYCDCGTTKHTNYEMSTEEIFAMLRQFARMGTRRFSITGGEPLLKKNLPEIVNYARKLGIFVSVATNGVMIPRKIDELLNVSSFNITLDGPEELNDIQRGKGTYHKIVAAVECIKKKGIPVYLNCVITKHNCHALPEIIALAKSLKVKILAQPVFYSEPSHAGTLEGYKKAKYDDEKMGKTLEYLIQLKENREPSLMLSAKYYSEVLNYLRTGQKMKCTFAKKKGQVYCTISPEGYVTPCNLLVRDKKYLNGLEIGFEKAFMNMPELNCAGCISSFIDIDYLLTYDQAVLMSYTRHYMDNVPWIAKVQSTLGFLFPSGQSQKQLSEATSAQPD